MKFVLLLLRNFRIINWFLLSMGSSYEMFRYFNYEETTQNGVITAILLIVLFLLRLNIVVHVHAPHICPLIFRCRSTIVMMRVLWVINLVCTFFSVLLIYRQPLFHPMALLPLTTLGIVMLLLDFFEMDKEIIAIRRIARTQHTDESDDENDCAESDPKPGLSGSH